MGEFMEDLVGKTIDRYKIISELGRGGVAVVYRALDTLLDRQVAIKMILPENSNKEKLLKRFNREAKTLANLSHPNIVKVLDYGDYEETPYLVLEFISGGMLKAKMGKPMNYAEAAGMLVPVARALSYAHQQKLVHRDIKPANILINDSGQPMLSDFGILKLIDLEETQGLTGTGRIVGTPAYMSPEQIRGREIDGRADLYSLAVVFFEMVTGRKPYNANTPIELSMQHLHDPIPKAKQFVRDLPAEVEQLFVKALAKNPDERYSSMNAFVQALEKIAGVATTSTSEWKAISDKKQETAERKPIKLNGALILGVLALFLLGIGAVLFRQIGTAAPTPVTEPTANTISQPLPTKSLKTPVPTRTSNPVTDTPTAGYTFEVATEDPATPVAMIQPSGVSQIVEVNRIDKISVLKMDWVENGNWLINAGSNGISFIDPTAAAIKEKINLGGEIPIAMTVSPINNKLYVLLSNNIKVFDIQTYKEVTSYPVTGGVYSIAASPDGNLLALGILDNKVQLVNAEDGRVIRNLRSNYGGWSVAFSPDSSIVVGGSSQGILMWESGTGLWLPSTGGENNSIKTLAFSNNGKMLAGGSKGIIFFWDIASGNTHFRASGDFGEVSSIDFSPDDSMLVSGSEDGIVRLWNTQDGQLLRALTGHTSPIFGVCFSPSGQYIASGANEGTIRIWGMP
jgi:serine/threonine protein kinase